MVNYWWVPFMATLIWINPEFQKFILFVVYGIVMWKLGEDSKRDNNE